MQPQQAAVPTEWQGRAGWGAAPAGRPGLAGAPPLLGVDPPHKVKDQGVDQVGRLVLGAAA